MYICKKNKLAYTLNPLSRNPDLTFEDITVTPSAPVELSGGAKSLGTVRATAHLPGWAPTPMHFRIIRTGQHILLGQRCGLLHTPHLNARNASAETLWCTNCWHDASATGKGSLIVPFYLYYRHYDDHILDHLPTCPGCGRRFQVWDSDQSLQEGFTHMFSAYSHPHLLSVVVGKLNPRGAEFER